MLIRPKEGILDPQGKAVERALPALGFEGIEHVRVGRMVELEAEDPERLAELCEKLLANPLIEDYEIQTRCDLGSAPVPRLLRRAGRAARLRAGGGEARLVWHEERDLGGVDAVVVPGGFSYGDYLRAGAIARFSPAMEAVAELAAAGGPVLGICNGFQVLCEAGLLPGALLRNDEPPLRLPPGRADRGDRLASGIDAGERLSIPVKHGEGRYYAPEEMLDELEANGQVAFRYAPGQNPNGSVARHRRGPQRGRQRARPDAAPRARGRPADRLDRRPAASSRRVAADASRGMTRREQPAKHRELGLTDSEYELIVEKLGREPNDVELAMFSLLWSEHCAYKHSRKLLRRLPTEGERVVMGPGENAGAVDIGNGYAVAFKVESHNHPSAVEPFQGAATGVGGILRDVFALGARPIAILD